MGGSTWVYRSESRRKGQGVGISQPGRFVTHKWVVGRCMVERRVADSRVAGRGVRG